MLPSSGPLNDLFNTDGDDRPATAVTVQKNKGTGMDTGNIHPVILSGGSGTRLWPVSRSLYPKQLLPLVGERTMLQETALRLSGRSGIGNPLIICNSDHRFIIAEQLRAIAVTPADIVLEPVGRNTAPAVAVAALAIQKQDPDGVLAILPADHAITDADGFARAVCHAATLARQGYLVTFGIEPDRPHTGYGYIRRGDAIDEQAWTVDRFVEKPDEDTARQYLADGGYSWNAGIFVLAAGVFIDELARHDPDTLQACRAALEGAERDLDFCRLDADAFARAENISVDYAVMEKTSRAAVIPVDIGWNDVGAWDALWEIGDKDENGNVLLGDVIAEGVSNSYLRSEDALLAAVDIDDIAVIQTRDAVLVTPRHKTERVKAIVARLKAADRTEQSSHTRHYRPWGYYETIDIGKRFQVKHLMVKPGARLSLQLHHHRAEHWIVVSGTARVTRGDQEMLLSENESTYIPIGTRHRLENPGKVDLDIIEVQSGSYLGEDDIVRLEDIYNRDDSETN